MKFVPDSVTTTCAPRETVVGDADDSTGRGHPEIWFENRSLSTPKSFTALTATYVLAQLVSPVSVYCVVFPTSTCAL